MCSEFLKCIIQKTSYYVIYIGILFKLPGASFLKVSLRLRGELAPTQWWRLAQLAPTRELAPAEVLKNCPLGVVGGGYFDFLFNFHII
jgi:hypothetical protein